MAAIYSQFNTPQLILIGRENFAVWQLAMQALLQVKGLWGCITGDPEYVGDVQKDPLARTLIILSIESYNYIHVQDTKTAKEAWDKLQSVFGGSGLLGKIRVVRGLVPTQLVDYPSMEEYVDEIIKSSLKLRSMDFEVTDEWIGIQLLAGLTNDYWPLIVELDSSEAVITGDSVKALLLKDIKKSEATEESCENSSMCVKDEHIKETRSLSSSPKLVGVDEVQNDFGSSSPSISKGVKDWYNNFCESSEVSKSWQRAPSTSGNSSASALSPCSSMKKEDLEVEVRGDHGGYFEAFIVDVFDNEVEVAFDPELQFKAKFALADVRLPPRNDVKPQLRKGQEIEVYTRVTDKNSWGWWKARVDINMGNGYVIVEIPEWLGSRFGRGECVPLDRLRAPNPNPPINSRTFRKREILVPEEQRESAGQNNIHKDFQRAIGAASCRYLPEKGVLLLISRNPNLDTLSSWLDEMHFGDTPRDGCYLRQLRMTDSSEPPFSNFS